mgnify:CR=1 FL=1
MEKETVTGRIIKSLGGFYYVQAPGGMVECRARGSFRNQNIKPCVGDMAIAELTQEGKGYVVELLPRSNSLVRPPLANLDQLILVVSIAQPVPNALVLDKLIAIAECQRIQPVIVVTKADLKPAEAEEFASLYRKAGFPVVTVCSLTGQGVEGVERLLAGKLSAFCGNSGAGKSSLLNAIDARFAINTGNISQKLGRGRHTTRHVEIYTLPNGGQVADTPGFSAVDMEKFQIIRKDDLQYCFREFEPYIGQCQFTGCSHTKERGCRVLQAVQAGEISSQRHQSYCTLYEEAKLIKEWELR